MDVSLQVSLRDDQSELTEAQKPKVADRYKMVPAEKGGKRRQVIKGGVEDVIRFLAENPTTKIMVIIETHSLENGRLIWSTDKGDFQGCFMHEVSTALSLYVPTVFSY